MSFSITRILVGMGLAFLATILALVLILVVMFGPTWAKIAAGLLLFLDFFG